MCVWCILVVVVVIVVVFLHACGREGRARDWMRKRKLVHEQVAAGLYQSRSLVLLLSWSSLSSHNSGPRSSGSIFL